MRIAGGVLLLVVGLWSLGGGFLSVTHARMLTSLAQSLDGVGAEQGTAHLSEAAKALGLQAGAAGGILASGIVVLGGGLLCAVAGILLFLNKGRALGFLAVGVALSGEVLVLQLVAFSVSGFLKILMLVLCAFAATKVGTEEA